MRGGPLDNVIVVLDEPQDLVNIAGVVRAMKNMGLRRLRLVRPREFDTWRITGIAHRTDDILEASEMFDSLDEAVAECVLVLATTARARTAQRNFGTPREWAGRILETAIEGPVAIVFGREDRGLSNEALDRCDGALVIPTVPDYSSLNLAQASLVIAYELHLAAAGGHLEMPVGKRSAGRATRGEMEVMFEALQEGLHHLEFFRARSAESVMRTFRTLLSRAEPDRHEVGLVRAMAYEIRNRVTRLQGRPSRGDGMVSDPGQEGTPEEVAGQGEAPADDPRSRAREGQ